MCWLIQGLTKKEVKPVKEAMLMILGSALNSGKELNLLIFGGLVMKNTKRGLR